MAWWGIAPSHPHCHSLPVLLAHSLPLHSLCCSLLPSPSHSLPVFLTVTPSHSHSLCWSLTPHNHTLSLCCSLTFHPPYVTPSYPHHHTPSLCCSPVTITINEGSRRHPVHSLLPIPLCICRVHLTFPLRFLFFSFLAIHIYDFITSSFHPSQQGPWPLECLWLLRYEAAVTSGSEDAVRWPGMMESVQQYAIYMWLHKFIRTHAYTQT